jgi:putative transposase
MPGYSSRMPRTARAIVANHCYHVINRGNNQLARFHERADYLAFLWLLAEAQDHVYLPILAACLMPNHIHLVVRPREDDAVARWTHWLFTTHARRYHKKYKSSGRVWQGRFKAFVMQDDRHYLTVLRYVEQNASRARLVARAEHWEWGSLHWRNSRHAPVELTESPLALPRDWTDYVNQPLTSREIEAVRKSVNRQSPFGNEEWAARKAAEFGISHTLAPLGRPRKTNVTEK